MEELEIDEEFLEMYESGISIHESKKKNTKLFILSLGMMIISMVIFFIDFEYNVIMKIIGKVGILFFGLGSVVIFRKIFKKDPVLILNKEGFANKHQSYSEEIEFIPWSRVKEISVMSMTTEELVCIDIDNEEEYIESLGKAIMFGVKANKKMGYPVITLSANSLEDFNNEKLYMIFALFYYMYNTNLNIEEN